MQVRVLPCAPVNQRVGEPGRPCLPWKQEIGGSNPSTLTTTLKNKQERSVSDIKVYGEHEPKTLAQMQRCMTVGSAVKGVLCADGHLGYASTFCTRCGRSPSRWPGRESSTPTRTEGGVRATPFHRPALRARNVVLVAQRMRAAVF